MTSNLSVFAFAISILGLFFSFDILPGGSSFVGATMLLLGGTILVCHLILHRRPAR